MLYKRKKHGKLGMAGILFVLCLVVSGCVGSQDGKNTSTVAGNSVTETSQAEKTEAETSQAVSADVQETTAVQGGDAAGETASQSAKSAFEILPAAQADPSSEFGVDQNVNMDTLDQYLGLKDAVYRDMRMPADPYDYAAIGGDSILSGMIEGFTAIGYPYLAPTLGMPEVLGEGYDGPTLFSVREDGSYAANYQESLDILEQIFPKDQAIFLMCGAGGYASMTKNLLVNLGWDANLIYNVGGYWFYQGSHNVPVSQPGENGLYRFEGLDIYEIDFARLTPVQEP